MDESKTKKKKKNLQRQRKKAGIERKSWTNFHIEKGLKSI